MTFDELVDFFQVCVYPSLSRPAQGGIESDVLAGEYELLIDSYLQFSLLDGVEIPQEILDATETEVRAGWDPELTERTLGWIAKHREKAQAA